MKGLHHSVIEIKDTENSNIEKILVFLKPHRQKIDVGATRKEAQEILRKVKIRERLPRYNIDFRHVVIFLWAIVSLIGIMAILF